MIFQEVLNSQEIFGDELAMFAKKELQKEVIKYLCVCVYKVFKCTGMKYNRGQDMRSSKTMVALRFASICLAGIK